MLTKEHELFCLGLYANILDCVHSVRIFLLLNLQGTCLNFQLGYNLFISSNCTHSYLTMVYVIILDTVIFNLFEHTYNVL